jgi:hypothetical protein
VAPAAAEVGAAEMPTAMAAATKMRAAMATTVTAAMSAPMTTTAMTTTATFRRGIAGGRQRGRKNKDGNSNLEF